MSSFNICDTIPEFFKGKNVFVTGASGFMGKVLIEKLMRSCPEIGNIYILLRLKKSSSLQERVEDIKKNILFDRLKKEQPDALSKIIPIQGDIKDLNLGLSDEDRQILIDNVTIVYHIAAIVKFNDTLRDAIIMNTRGTREVCNLVLSLKAVDAFVHVSTAYCQIDNFTIEEKMYPNRANWKQMIEAAESLDPYQLQIIHHKVMDVYPNTYTFSKALAESAVKDMCENKVPTVVIRPTIVVSVYKDPMFGWHDNLMGPTTLLIARSKGVLRSSFSNWNSKMDMVPVDYVIKTCVKSAWLQQYIGKKEISVYNSSSEGIYALTLDFLIDLSKDLTEKLKIKTVWYPNTQTVTDNKMIYLFHIYFYHLLPAVFVDSILKLLRKPPQVLKLQRKFFIAFGCLEYFSSRRWIINNQKALALDDYLKESDRNDFAENLSDFEVDKFLIGASKKIFNLMLHEETDNENYYRRTIMLGYVHKTLKFLFISVLVYLIYQKIFSTKIQALLEV